MTSKATEMPRRAMLRSLAGLAASSVTMTAQDASGATPALPAAPGKAPGKPGDFDFLAGNWSISHRKLKTPGGDDWDAFKGEATCWTILGGVGSVEELRIPARDFSGVGLRLLDVENHVWSDYWINGRSGVLTTPGMTGAFEDGVGTFVADDVDGGQPIKVRGVWDRITPTSCRWRQGVSRDGGRVWEESWFMDWARV